MRRRFVHWLKTQWTAVPLAFLIVTVVEVWRLDDRTTGDDGHSRREASGLVADLPSADAVKLQSTRRPTDQLPSTKSSPKIDQKPTGVNQKSLKDVAKEGDIL